MLSNWPAVRDLILASEGPELNQSPDEPGGASRYGVSVTALSDYNRTVGRPSATVQDVVSMTAELAGQFYEWRAGLAGFGSLRSGVDYRVFDAAVTLGVRGASEILQICLGTWRFTGIVDADTVALANAEDPVVLIHALSSAWLVHKLGDGGATGWAKYGYGWTNRRNRVLEDSLAMVTK